MPAEEREAGLMRRKSPLLIYREPSGTLFYFRSENVCDRNTIFRKPTPTNGSRASFRSRRYFPLNHHVSRLATAGSRTSALKICPAPSNVIQDMGQPRMSPRPLAIISPDGFYSSFPPHKKTRYHPAAGLLKIGKVWELIPWDPSSLSPPPAWEEQLRWVESPPRSAWAWEE